MAIRGRKPKPTHLKLVTGNPGKRALNKAEAKVLPALPSPPPHLCDEGKVEWGRVSQDLFDAGLLTKIDRGSLAIYCQAYGRWVRAENALAAMAAADTEFHGLLIKTSNGNVIQNPLVGTANTAMGAVNKYAVEFGMTPSSRSRISVASGDREGNEFAEFG